MMPDSTHPSPERLRVEIALPFQEKLLVQRLDSVRCCVPEERCWCQKHALFSIRDLVCKPSYRGWQRCARLCEPLGPEGVNNFPHCRDSPCVEAQACATRGWGAERKLPAGVGGCVYYCVCTGMHVPVCVMGICLSVCLCVCLCGCLCMCVCECVCVCMKVACARVHVSHAYAHRCRCLHRDCRRRRRRRRRHRHRRHRHHRLRRYQHRANSLAVGQTNVTIQAPYAAAVATGTSTSTSTTSTRTALIM